MAEAVSALQGLIAPVWQGMNSVDVPILGFSFLALWLAVFAFNWFLKVFGVLTNSSVDKEKSQPGLDNNNHYIYRR